MFLEDKGFNKDNTTSSNKLVFKIILGLNFVSPLFLLFKYLHIFEMQTFLCISLIAIASIYSIIEYILIYRTKKQNVAKYFGLIGISLIICYLGTDSHCGIYVSYCLPLFFASLYYDVKLVVVVAVFSFFGMMVSLFFKGVDLIRLGEFASDLAKDRSSTPSPWFFLLKRGSGFTMEFIFAFLTSFYLAKTHMFHYNMAYSSAKKLKNTQLDVMNFVPNVLESHEIFTGHHVRHTVKYVEMICKKLVEQGLYIEELTEENIKVFSAAANLHDIGKVHIPDNILNKPGRYTPEEFSMMKMHPAEGKKLIESMPKLNFGDFNNIARDMTYYHHEKFDGTGYPEGLKGYDIPLCARIMAAADVLDALLSWRPYKNPFDIDKTMEIFKDSRGTHFEECIADCVISLKDEILEVSNNFKENENEDELKEYEWRVQLEKGKANA